MKQPIFLVFHSEGVEVVLLGDFRGVAEEFDLAVGVAVGEGQADVSEVVFVVVFVEDFALLGVVDDAAVGGVGGFEEVVAAAGFGEGE